MKRDLEKEIDDIKKEIDDLKKHTGSKRADILSDAQLKQSLCENENLINEARCLEEAYKNSGDTGAVSYVGIFGSSGNTSIWARDAISTDFLLSLNENQMAEKVLNSIGNGQRLSILLTLLKKPMTATQLIEELDLNTTGQVYHHLKSLTAADLITDKEQGERGIYSVKPHRVQGIVMLLAGVWDMIDNKYTKGTRE